MVTLVSLAGFWITDRVSLQEGVFEGVSRGVYLRRAHLPRMQEAHLTDRGSRTPAFALSIS